MRRRSEGLEKRDRVIYGNPKLVIVFAIFLNFLWGASLPLIKLCYKLFQINGGEFFTQIFFAGMLLSTTGTVVSLVSFYRGTPFLPKSSGEWARLLKLSLLMSISQYILLYIGSALASGIEASILSSSGAFVGIIFSGFVFKDDPFTTRKLLGCLLGLTSVVLLNIGEITGGALTLSVIGGLLIILSQSMGVLGAIYLKYISQGRDALWLCGWQTLIGGITLCVVGSLGGGSLNASHNLEGFKSFLFLAFCASLAAVISTQLYKYVDISKVVIFNFLLPIFGSLASAALLGESLASFTLLVSLSFTCVGVYLVTKSGGKPKKKDQPA
jgi:drug/metabolite transporter (DMT)-like permease